MSSLVSPRVRLYVGLAGSGFVAAILIGRPLLAELALPFAIFALWASLRARRPQIGSEIRVDATPRVAGDLLGATVTVCSPREAGVEVRLRPQAGLSAVETPGRVQLRPGRPETLDVVIRCDRWGRYRPGSFELVFGDALGLFAHTLRIDSPEEVKVYPRVEHVRALLAPQRLRPSTGDLVARTKGDGIEFGDVREYVAGDAARRINWSVSARRGRYFVNEYHPERNADVVLFVDTFTDVGAGEGATLDRAVEGAVALVGRHLRRRDRVGLILYGGTLSWVPPGSGLRHFYRIVDELLNADVFHTPAERPVSAVPRHLLPPQALVLALTPLVDERLLKALVDLRRRRHDIVVVELPVSADGGSAEDDPAGEAALRLWNLHRRARVAKLVSLGIPVAPWRTGAPLEGTVMGVGEWRRRAHRRLAQS